jgi:protocatechuate 3,4-dioxygenase alpha subunit
MSEHAVRANQHCGEPLQLTPSQTVGPFLHLALADPGLCFGVAPDSEGAIHVHGTVTDGAGTPVPDAVVETWQADGVFTRCPTDGDGTFEIVTRKPPAELTVDGTAQAPHLSVTVFARGLLDRVVTRIYFPEEDAANAADPTLAAVDPERRHLLVAAADGNGTYRFDIRLQGDDESVFLAI